MSSVEKIIDKDDLEELIEDWTIHRNEFVLLFFADGILCIVVLVIISQLFTKNLTDHILEPLDALSDGAKRIRNNDLRTPLTAIRGTIKGLMDGVVSTPEKQEKFLETAYRRAGDMDLLLNQLFYLSKIETGNMPIDLRKIEISSFIQNYVQAKQGLMEFGKEELIAETKEITEEVTVDPEQL